MIKIKNSFQITGEVKITKGLSPTLPERIKEKYIDNGFSELLSKSNTILRYGKNALVRKIWGVDVSAELGAVTKLAVGDGFTDFCPWGEPIVASSVDYSLDQSASHELNNFVFDADLDIDEDIEVEEGVGFSKTVWVVLKSFEHSPDQSSDPYPWKENNSFSYINELGLADASHNCFSRIYFTPFIFDKHSDDILTISWKIILKEHND